MKNKLAVIILFFSIFLFSISETALAASSYTDEEYELCFLIDVSGSMRQDKIGEAVIEFMSSSLEILEGTNTSIRLVCYNHSIICNSQEFYINSNMEKEELINILAQIKFNGDTDIGLGIKTAVEGFTNKKSKKIIIMFSDGETDLPSYKYKKTVEESELEKQEAIEKAKENGIYIYTIGLTNKFDGNIDTLKSISKATNGDAYTAVSMYQIFQAFADIIQKHYTTALYEAADLIASDVIKNPEISLDLSDGVISNAGVIIFKESDGKEPEVLVSEKDLIIINGRYCNVYKQNGFLKEPLTISFLNSEQKALIWGMYSLREDISIDETTDKRKNTEIKLSFKDNITGKTITNEDFYKNLSVSYIIKNIETFEQRRVDAVPGINTISAVLSFDKKGIYEIYTEYESMFLKGFTEKVRINVTNKIPVADDDIKVIVLGRSSGSIIDISGLFSDTDGDRLELGISKSADNNAFINGTNLHINPESYGELCYVLQAEDEEGEIVYANVYVNSQTFFEYYRKEVITIVIIIIIILTLLISLLIWRHYRKKPEIVLENAPSEPYFEGVLTGCFLNVKSGDEIDPIKWELKQYHLKSITLAQLLELKKIDIGLQGAEKIEFKAGRERTIELFHRSDSVVLVGSKEIRKRENTVVHYGDKIYICFEDGLTEIEIRYKNI